MTNTNRVTLRLAVVADLLKLEAKLRSLGSSMSTSDRGAVRSIQNARDSILQETDG